MNTVEDALKRIRQCRTAVLGDFTMDFYIEVDGKEGEPSIETGLPTLPVSAWRISPGGAGNVAVNLAALGVKTVKAFGVTGDDMFGDQMLRDLRINGVDTKGIIRQKENWDTHVYTKILDNGQEGRRIDFGSFNSPYKKTEDSVIESLEKVIAETDVVIINQQLKTGIHTSYFRNRLKKFMKKHPSPLYITDSRDFPEDFEGSARKLNTEEALEVLYRAGIELKHCSELDRDKELVRILYTLWKQPVFLTRKEKGIIVYDRKGLYIIPGISITDDIDTVGAGDTALAGISAAWGSGSSPEEAAVLGNLAASVTVQKLHTTGTASGEEIIYAGKKAVYIHNPELAEDDRQASFWNNTEIEVINEPVRNQDFRYIIFDHDGTISTLRQGWEQVMEPVMVEAITGGASVPGGLYEQIRKKVLEFIERTTGIQTLVQMKGLTGLVKEFGIVPENRILDEHIYKKIYNNKLMEMVRKRTEKFRKGELGIDDVTVKNAVPFLEELRQRGAVLFLASGTDQDDVREETELLGYAHLFTGGIFGATGNIQEEPKRKVIASILEKIGTDKSAWILTFGDGPVEIAETKRSGGFTVGIASDEIRRYGLNRTKRTRLIKSGADVIIPDYSQKEKLFTYLGWK